MKREAVLRVARGNQTSGVGTSPRDRAGRTGTGDPKEDAARLRSDHLRRFFTFLHPLDEHPTLQ
jgi:hypothetical protein